MQRFCFGMKNVQDANVKVERKPIVSAQEKSSHLNVVTNGPIESVALPNEKMKHVTAHKDLQDA